MQQYSSAMQYSSQNRETTLETSSVLRTDQSLKQDRTRRIICIPLLLYPCPAKGENLFVTEDTEDYRCNFETCVKDIYVYFSENCVTCKYIIFRAEDCLKSHGNAALHTKRSSQSTWRNTFPVGKDSSISPQRFLHQEDDKEYDPLLNSIGFSPRAATTLLTKK